jgi:hypothetical protein
VAGGEAVCVRQRNAIMQSIKRFHCIGLGKMQGCAVQKAQSKNCLPMNDPREKVSHESS